MTFVGYSLQVCIVPLTVNYWRKGLNLEQILWKVEIKKNKSFTGFRTRGLFKINRRRVGVIARREVLWKRKGTINYDTKISAKVNEPFLLFSFQTFMKGFLVLSQHKFSFISHSETQQLSILLLSFFSSKCAKSMAINIFVVIISDQ